jgi:hypothetical protein
MDLLMAHLLRSTTSFVLIATAACQAGMASSTEPSVTDPKPVAARLDDAADLNADLEARYRLAIESFDRGAYDDAAAQFAQMLVRVPQDPSGDHLRHLLIQHVAWSLLGSYDMSRDSGKLDSGEAILERYLVKHEQLRPAATGERVEIFALLGEYTLRRDDRPPTNANAYLQALVRETHANLQRPVPRTRESNDDRMVREIEVDAVDGVRWASLDDPWVQAYLRDPRYAGASLFDESEPYNRTRVLVRGWVDKSSQTNAPIHRRAYDMLRAARPALERCYEDALGRGADTHEQVDLALHWDLGSLAEIEITEQSIADNQTSSCVIAALREATEADVTEADAVDDAHAKLHLTFFVQPPRWPERIPAEINQDAEPEDVSIGRCVSGPTRC